MSDNTYFSGPLSGWYQDVGQDKVYNHHDSWSTKLTIHRDPTIRRIKPTNLNRSRTSRTVSDTLVTTEMVTYTSGTRTTSEPLDYNELAGQAKLLQLDIAACDGKIRMGIKEENTNLAQSCAEYRQTCSMFGKLASDMFSAFRSLRKDCGLSALVKLLKTPRGRVEKGIANRWLEYQYGFRPLMQDLHNVADDMTRRPREGFDRRISKRTTQRENWAWELPAPGIPGNPTVKRDETWTYQLRTTAIYTVSEPGIAQLSSYGITNPAELAWELIPYSFVVDWMIPVGDYLASLDALLGVSNLKVYSSYRLDIDHFVNCLEATGSYRHTRFVRLASRDGLELPRLIYKPSSSLTAVLNGLALLRQMR